MSSVSDQLVTPEIIADAMDYNEYRQRIEELLKEGKTTGSNHSEAMISYTRMNVQRMNRLDKHVELSKDLMETLHQVDEKWVWLVLTEAWCGDAAQNVPVIAKMADQNESIDLKLILRDNNLDIMDEYLTNGGRSIPKLVCLDAETQEEKGSWGPRPDQAQDLAMKLKDDPEVSTKEWAEKLHKWYAGDRTKEIQSEFVDLISSWSEN